MVESISAGINKRIAIPPMAVEQGEYMIYPLTCQNEFLSCEHQCNSGNGRALNPQN